MLIKIKVWWQTRLRAVKMALIGGSMLLLSIGLLWVLPYSKNALYLLAGLDFFGLCFLAMACLYLLIDTVKLYRKKKNVTE